MRARGTGRPILCLLLAGLALAAPAAAQDWGGWWSDYEPELLWGDHPWSQRRVQTLPTVVEPELVDTLVVPSLLELAGTHDLRLRINVVYALGAVAGPDSRAAASAALLLALQDRENAVRTQAAQGLGLAYEPERGADLVELARDSAAGRRLVDNEPLHDDVRFAAIGGLGAARDLAHAPALMELFDDLEPKRHELRRAVLRALGRCGAGSDEVREFLEDRVADRMLEEVVRSAAARALAELGEPQALPALTKVFGKSGLDTTVQASVLLAIGELAAPDDTKSLKLLLREAFSNADAEVRTRALMGAALLLARDADPGANERNHELFVETLEEQLDSPRFRGDGALHALASGFYARAHIERGRPLTTLVLEGLDDFKDPLERGAYALALALAPPPDTGALLLEVFRDIKHPSVRAPLAEALGMLRHAPALAELQEALAENGQVDGVIDGCGIALVLLGDEQAVGWLQGVIAEDGNVESRTARVAVLGHFRTEAAVRALHGLLVDETVDQATRAAACNALARAATARVTPWYAPY